MRYIDSGVQLLSNGSQENLRGNRTTVASVSVRAGGEERMDGTDREE